MANKKRSWFNLVKRFFISDTPSKHVKRHKRRKWILFGRFKIKSKVPSITAPSPGRERTRLVEEAEEEQSKHALNVAIATAAAAEAAVAAAHVAAQVVLLTGLPQSTHQFEKKTEESSDVRTLLDDSHRTHHQSKRDIQEFAAIKIQTAFRGCLARKALRALRGIVKLQAIIRGTNVRRQAIHTLKCLQSIVHIQSQVSAKKTHKDDENKRLVSLREEIMKMDTISQKQWNGSNLTKEEADALFLSKKDAAIKRERIREYSFSQRNSAETDRSKLDGRWRYWLEQWVDTQLSKSKELEDLDSVIITSNPNPKVEYRRKQIKGRGSPRQYQTEGLVSPVAASGRSQSHHRRQSSLGNDKSCSGSPLVPTYMAATESAKAKARSLSSPRIRPGAFDAYSDSYSPSKNKLSLVSTTATELTNSDRSGRPSAYQQRSPSLRGLPGLVKSTRTLKDLSIDSQCSFRTWDHPIPSSFW